MTTEDKSHLFISNRFENIEFIGDGRMLIGVPFDAPEDFKKLVWAASECYVWGNKSVDYHYKKYSASYSFSRPKVTQRRLFKILSLSMHEVDKVHDELTNGVERKTCSGLFAAEAALTRLKSTFQSASFLLLQGHLYEASALMRLVLEQLGWAYSVYEMEGDEFFGVNPTKSITHLKDVIPHAGRFYSRLSNYAHLHPDLQSQYLDFSGEFASINHKQHDNTLRMGVNFAFLVSDYRVVSEHISFEYFRSPVAWTVANNDRLERDVNYYFDKMVEEFKSQVFVDNDA